MENIYPFQAMGQHIQNAVAEIPPQIDFSGPSWEEMEAKRQEMIASFKDIAAAMTRCVSIIEDYTRLTPSSLPANTTTQDHGQVNYSAIPTTNTAAGATNSSAINPPGIGVGGKASRKSEVVADGEPKKRKKKEKKPKDPNAPRRPPSAYLLFQNEQREGIKAADPNIAYKDILNEVSERWKKLNPVQKKVYEDAYNHANEEYKQLDAAYKATQAAVQAQSDSSSDDSDDSSDDPAPKTRPMMHQQMQHVPPVTTAPLQVPTTLNAAVGVGSVPQKKERKRKNKAEEVPMAGGVMPTDGEKKKKKKGKE